MNVRNAHSFMGGSLRVLAAAAALGLAALAQAADEPGRWQSHKLTFDYLGFTPTYSCQGLYDALNFLLTQSGARLDRPVVALGCSGGVGRPSKLISADLQFSTLQPSGGAADSGGAAQVPGTWRQVEFSAARSSPQLGGADCELVDEFKDRILRLFATRNVHATLRCVPYQAFGDQYSLRFEVFVPTATPARAVGGRG